MNGRGGDQDTAETTRQPWMAVHAREIDADRDGRVTHAELRDEIARTFAGYDHDANDRLTPDEYRAGGWTQIGLGRIRT